MRLTAIKAEVAGRGRAVGAPVDTGMIKRHIGKDRSVASDATDDVTDEDISDVVDEYARTHEQLLGYEIPRELAAARVHQTIRYIADNAGVPGKTALRVVDVAWARDLARQEYRRDQELAAQARAEPVRRLPLVEVNRLIISIELSLRYAAVNNANLTDRFSPEIARDAKDGLLHWALNSRAGDPAVTVAGSTVLYARICLTAFGGNLASQRWTSCRCNTACSEHRETDKGVLRAVRQQLRLLGA
jgi:hypothetical protein